MATKSYTDLEQSRKLAELLPLESADMRFCFCHTLDGRITLHYPLLGREPSMGTIPCWSLAALLEILKRVANKIDDDGSANLSSFMGQWSVNMFNCPVEATDNYDNQVDACYEMIINLHELNLL